MQKLLDIVDTAIAHAILAVAEVVLNVYTQRKCP